MIFTESNDWWLWWRGANYVDDWDNGIAGMWFTFKHYPPTDAEESRLPKP